MTRELLRLRDVEKSLHNDQVLEDVNMQVFAGELVGLIGLQQTGKTALVRILQGLDKPDGGRLYVDEAPAEFSGPAAAHQAGIYTLSVKGLLAGDMTVAENLYAINHPLLPPVLSPRDLIARTRFTFRQFGLDIPPKTRVKDLSRTEQAVLSLLQIVLQEPKLVILDSGIEYELEDYATFQRMVLHFRSVGISFLVVSNKVSKLVEICDRVYAIKNNTLSASLSQRDFDAKTLSRILAGGPGEAPAAPAPAPAPGPPLLELSGLRLDEKSPPIDFSLRRGEVCALIPPPSLAADALGYTLFGMRRAYSGAIYIEGRRACFRRARDAIRQGLALVPSDLESVVFRRFDLKGNLLFPYIASSRHVLRIVNPKFSRVASAELKKAYSIHCDDTVRQMAGRKLSYSNLHRISVARWEPLKPKLYIFINPFSVTDEQTAGDLRALFLRLAGNGCGVLVLSTSVYGLKSVCTRIVQL